VLKPTVYYNHLFVKFTKALLKLFMEILGGRKPSSLICRGLNHNEVTELKDGEQVHKLQSKQMCKASASRGFNLGILKWQVKSQSMLVLFPY